MTAESLSSRCCSASPTRWTPSAGAARVNALRRSVDDRARRRTSSTATEFQRGAPPRRGPGGGDDAGLRSRRGSRRIDAPGRRPTDVRRPAAGRRGGRRRRRHAADDGDPRDRLHAADPHRVRRLPERDAHRRPARSAPTTRGTGSAQGLLDWFARLRDRAGVGNRPDGRWERADRELVQRGRRASAACRPTRPRCSGSSGRNRDALELDPTAYTRIASVRPCVRTSPDDGLPLRETVAECVQYVKIPAAELGAYGLDKPGGHARRHRGRARGRQHADPRRVRAAEVRDRTTGCRSRDEPTRTSRRRRQRLDYLWEQGHFDRGRRSLRRLAAIHRLRADEHAGARRDGGLVMADAADARAHPGLQRRLRRLLPADVRLRATTETRHVLIDFGTHRAAASSRPDRGMLAIAEKIREDCGGKLHDRRRDPPPRRPHLRVRRASPARSSRRSSRSSSCSRGRRTRPGARRARRLPAGVRRRRAGARRRRLRRTCRRVAAAVADEVPAARRRRRRCRKTVARAARVPRRDQPQERACRART